MNGQAALLQSYCAPYRIVSFVSREIHFQGLADIGRWFGRNLDIRPIELHHNRSAVSFQNVSGRLNHGSRLGTDYAPKPTNNNRMKDSATVRTVF